MHHLVLDPLLIRSNDTRPTYPSLQSLIVVNMMPERPLCSVVMPAYRMGAYIGMALRSVADQTYTGWEVLVVDDHAPDDGTTAIVSAFAQEHPHHRVELIRHERNQGVSAARNTAISAAQGELVAFLDPDDRWLPIHLERMLECLRTKDVVDVVTGPVETFWEGDGAPAPHVWPIAEWQVRMFPTSLALSNFIQPSASLVRRSVLLEVGGFDTDPNLQHIEDYDLWIRLVERGSKFVFLETHTSSYRRHPMAASHDPARMHGLHDRLYAKHTAFFHNARGKLTTSLMRRVEPLPDELVQLRILLNGPVMRCIRSVDRMLRAVARTLRVGKG